MAFWYLLAQFFEPESVILTWTRNLHLQHILFLNSHILCNDISRQWYNFSFKGWSCVNLILRVWRNRMIAQEGSSCHRCLSPSAQKSNQERKGLKSRWEIWAAWDACTQEARNSPIASKFPMQSAHQLFYMSKHMWQMIIFPKVNQKIFFRSMVMKILTFLYEAKC